MGRIHRLTVIVGALTLALAATGCEPPPSPWRAERVNLDHAGNPQPVTLRAVDAAGTQLALDSATDLVGDGQGGGVFVRELASGDLTRASTRRGYEVRFSPDGTKLAILHERPFQEGQPGTADLIVADLTAGTSTAVLEPVGTFLIALIGPGMSSPLTSRPAVAWAPDGNRLVFSGTVLVPGLPEELPTCVLVYRGNRFPYTCRQLYVHDLAAGSTTIVSDSHDGGAFGDDNSDLGSFSPDGAQVLYRSSADNLLVAGAPHGTIYLEDLATGQRTAIDATAVSNPSASGWTEMSPDGAKVLFQTDANIFGPTDTNSASDVYVRDLATGDFELVSVNAAGTDSGDQASLGSHFSPDSSAVVFNSGASDLGGVDTNGRNDIFVRDLDAGITHLVTSKTDCTTASGEGVHGFFSFSPDGRSVLFGSSAHDLGATDENDRFDVYIHDLETCTTNLVSARSDGAGSGNDESNGARFVGPGRVVFDSLASDLVPGDAAGTEDLFVATLQGADLAITGAGDWNDGQQAYDLEVVNNGPDTAEGARVVLRPPPDAEFFSGSPGCVANIDLDVIECDLGDIAAGATVQVHMMLGIPEPPGSFSVAAAAESTTFDYDGRNDVAQFVSN